ncbi:dynamin family protein [Nannocystis pusilla]|uniref:dynamin family protein n=1 Tax=Nannocystis pusilla TaxID=889268 RepID=UPI003B81A872
MQRPGDAHLKLALAITRVAQVLTGNAHLSVLLELAEPPNKRGERALPETLAEATRLLLRDEFDPALDQLRRGRKLVEDAAEPALHDARFLLNLLTTLLQVRRGRFERGLLEFQRARARLPEGHVARCAPCWSARARSCSSPRITSTRRSPGSPARPTSATPPPRSTRAPPPRAYLSVALAAKGDRVGSEAVRAKVPARPEWEEHLVRVHLLLGTGAEARTLALRHLQQDPQSPRRKRLWALCEVAAWPVGGCDANASIRASVLDALVDAAASAAGERQERHLQELAHVALRADLLSDGTVALIRRRLQDGAASAPEELRLVNARRRLQDNDERAGEDFLPVRRRASAASPISAAPSAPTRSPPSRRQPAPRRPARPAGPGLRRVLPQEPCLRGQPARQPARGRTGVPGRGPHRSARARPGPGLLAQLAQPLQSNRLEDLLAAATALLAAIPSRVLGVPITGVADALSGVIAARERLARPLTIAVMGEFSSGKSTFVNALLGEVVAPMGVLPTTTTINFFRRGPTGGARVHYRDGSISTVARGEVHTFLRGLDDVAASRVRHMEIERTSARMGEAAVVDTPGLNALDGFHERVAREFVDEADAIIWIFSATRGGAASEAGVLKSMRADGRQVLGVLNKVDTLDPEERAELTDYLKQQFGDVLLDIIPVCASDALELRTGSADPEARHDDPFRAVEDALENTSSPTLASSSARSPPAAWATRSPAPAPPSARRSPASRPVPPRPAPSAPTPSISRRASSPSATRSTASSSPSTTCSLASASPSASSGPARAARSSSPSRTSPT